VASGPPRFEEPEWEEAAMPGQPVRARALFRNVPGDSPSRIAGCRWLCRNHSAGSGMPTFSLANTLRPILAACKQKTAPACAEVVDDETSLWTNVENSGKLVRSGPALSIVEGVLARQKSISPPSYRDTEKTKGIR